MRALVVGLAGLLLTSAAGDVAAKSPLRKDIGACPPGGVAHAVCRLAKQPTPARLRAVQRYGRRALPAIRRLLDSVDASYGRNKPMLWGLGQALCRLGAPGRRVIADYVAADGRRRNSGWRMVTQLGRGAYVDAPARRMARRRWNREVRPMLKALLADKRSRVRQTAIAATARAGKWGRPLAAFMAGLFKQFPAPVAHAIAKTDGPGSGMSVWVSRQIAPRLMRYKPGVASSLVRSLGQLRGLSPKRFAYVLLGLVRANKRLNNNIGGRQDTAWQTAMAFKMYGPTVRGPLVKALRDSNPAVRCAAMRALSGHLGYVGGSPHVYGPMPLDRRNTRLMVSLLRSKQKCLRLGALHILVNENYGPAIPHVVALLDRDPDTAVHLMRHLAAFRGLKTIRGRAYWRRKSLPRGAELGNAVKAELKGYRYKVHRGFGGPRPWRYRRRKP